ncbi:MAG: methylmalonyl-CoA mutase, partial [Myxococcales bacterium]
VWLEVGEHGVPVDAVAQALEKVLLDVAPVVIDAGTDVVGAARAFLDAAGDITLVPATNLGADPIGSALRAETEPGLDGLVEVAKLAHERGVLGVVVDASAVHDLGASDVQELGYAVAVGAAYLRALVDAGLSVDDAAGLIEFRLAATDEQFPTIAKLRAVRRLWSRVLEVSGAGADAVDSLRLHAVTSRPMMTKYDPWVNMLRTCVASFAAGVGGADAVTVLPFDAPLGLPDAFARRIARNTSSLLIDESHVAIVADPAGGSHVVEKLTDDMAQAGWSAFTQLEAEGGVLAALPALRERIDAVVAERDALVARRKRPITGLSEFPNLAETLPERAPYASGGFRVKSYGHAFEALRDEPASEPVFLATMGPVAAHTARATFASNLFAAGGIETINEGRHDDVEAVLAHYREEKVVCLVGSDSQYAEWGAELAAALREAGATWVIVAGQPLEGADDNAAMGVDALDFLTRTREKLA